MPEEKKNQKYIHEEKKLAPSNSQLKVSGERFFNIKTSIDRLTIIADYPTELLERVWTKMLLKPFFEVCGSGFKILDTSQPFFDSHGEEIPLEQVAYLEVPKFQKDKVRLDFNPNHGMKSEGGRWLLDFIKTLENKHYSRCDVAFDIFDYERTKDYKVWQWGSSEKIFYGRGHQMETTYYGSPASGKQIRQYNKLIEQKRKGKDIINHSSWWRLELQLRTGKVQDYPKLVKEMLENFFIPNYEQIDDLNKSAMVYRLMHDPNFYGKMARATQARYRKLIKETPHNNELAVAMAKQFVNDFDRLDAELQTVMRRFNVQAEEEDIYEL